MKLSLFAVLVFSSANPLSAFTTSFPASTFPTQGMEVAGVDGWTINDPGANNGTGLNSTMSFITTLDDGVKPASELPAAALGGWNDTPAANAPTTVFLSHAAPTSLQYAQFSTDFVIAASTNYPGRDGFGFSFRDSADNNLITISLVPAASVNNDTYQVSYTVGANPTLNAKENITGLDMYIEENGLYSLELGFTANGANPTFTATLFGSNGSQSFSDIATGLGVAMIDRFGVEWNTIAGEEGDNYIIFDNITLVPEPSSALLFGLGVLAFAARRRRA